MAISLTALSGFAQPSAADKASARKLAQEGVELYDAGRFQDALDRMQRAEALFDAPVHLLYIARSQQKLGLLIEAAETYRKLAHATVDASASSTFKEAIESGKRELSETEARIPELRVALSPSGVSSLVLTLDGAPIPGAATGSPRLTNPGHHVLRAEAPGYDPAEASFDLADAEKKTVELALPVNPANRGPEPTTAQPGAPRSDNRVSFFVGLRLAGVIPAGNLYKVDGEGVPASNFFAGGAMAELHGGVRFERYFALKLYLEGMAMGAGSWLKNQTSGADTTITGSGFGIGGMVGTRPGQWGGFGEIGFTLLRQYTIHNEYADYQPCGSNAETLSMNGFAFRIGGGAHIPVHRLIHLTPFMLANFGQITSMKDEDGCGNFIAGDLPSENRAGHQLFILGVGGDLLLGL